MVHLDLPGHGRSERGDSAESNFELCAHAVRDFCDALGIDRPVVYGGDPRSVTPEEWAPCWRLFGRG